MEGDTRFANTDTDDDEENTTQYVAMKKLKGIRESTQHVRRKAKYVILPQTIQWMPPRIFILKRNFAVEELRTQLSHEALTIVGSEPNSITQNATVCLCVAFRDKHG